MPVSFRTVGTWAELITDGAVTIPATPQAGDRMYLFARWKDFSVTAQVTDWTELIEFADGSNSSGNGTGSVKVGCWYRDWQSGDSNPTIDFSANPNNASAVIIVMAKAGTESWLTPVAVTAAMTNWTTSSQSVAASSTANVLASGVVMGLIGIRDDTATMTRPTSGIDDSTGAVTWGDGYVEAPATHHSTTTGDDGAADLGYRLVSAGATATLRMTGTISAAETGTALWVVQGIEFNATIQNASHAHTAENVSLTQIHAITVSNGSHANTVTNADLTQVHELGAQNSNHSHASETPSLTQLHELVAQDASHAHTAESPAITQDHVLVLADAQHGHSAEIPTLEVIHNLDIQNTAHAQIAESLTLTQEHVLVVANASHAHTAQSPVVKSYSIVFIDPGGDAVQNPGYFHTQVGGSGGVITFDTTQKVNGVGSYKFDSDDGDNPNVTVAGVMGTGRRVSAWFRYDSVPDATSSVTEFVNVNSIYSGGGFTDATDMSVDEGVYGTATPAKNGGQGTVFGSLGFDQGLSSGSIPNEAAIKSVKIIYERKYDVNTSIGISRVKYRIDGVEGPDHDNTDMPLVDTVVVVDITGDRESWARSELADGVFEVIAEARRGDSDNEHTQSWDYVKVVVEYFIPFSIIGPSGDGLAFEIALIPKGSGVVLKLIDGDKIWYDGITELLPNTDHRISWGHFLHDTNLVDIKLYIDAIEELSIVDAKCAGGVTNLVKLQYGWPITPGAAHVCWFDQIYVDNGDDLLDPGNVFSTAKLPATVNENNWDTDGGTGATNERPLSETNFKAHAADFDPQRQTYNLQTIDVGDIDLTGETLRGYMGWAWAKFEANFDQENIKLITNGVEVNRTLQLSTAPKLIIQPITTNVYPSNVRGIGMLSNSETTDTTMYECGVVVGYVGPANPNILLERQVVSNTTLDTIVDDLRASPPTSYELGYLVDDFDGLVTIRIYTIAFEGAEVVAYPTEYSSGGRARFYLPAGIEVRIDVEVVGSTNLMIYRRLNSTG